MMKKMLSLILCIAMLLSVCLTATAEQEALKVGLCIAETLGDKGFYDSANEGLQRLVDTYGVVGSVVECKSDASAYTDALVGSAEQNDIVVAVGWQFWDALVEVVPQMPETKFIFIDNAMDEIPENMLCITYKENEGSFLAGYIAMKISKTGVVGVVGGEDSATINNFIVGYQQGALYANPEGTVLAPIYTNTYEDPAKGKEAALGLYDQQADVVFACAGKSGLGVFEAGAEKKAYAIGVDSDQKAEAPDVIACSMMKLIGDSIFTVVEKYIQNGEFAGGTVWDADLSTGLIAIGYGDETMPQFVSAELLAEVDALAEKIISGEIVVESTR
ncbi:MAG: BMP family ABC transporter substrate-binding protein [Clostridiales bacterium]|nr:BMP family ABC transporter substrate-binding protein [Clostridiales bacterium]